MKNKAQATIKENITLFRLAPWVRENSEVVDLLRQYIKTRKEAILEVLRGSGALLQVASKSNIVVTRGRAVLAELLSGGATYTGEINYGALGTAVSPSPVNGSTQLGTEVFRKLASSQTFSDNIAYVDFFYTAGDTNGTYTEFGNFIDGTGSANSGRLFSYIATGGWVKTNLESLFVSCQYTIV